MTTAQVMNIDAQATQDSFSVWDMSNSNFNSIFDSGDHSLFLLEQVAGNIDVPAVMLEQLMFHPAHQIRIVLAGNVSLPADALFVLAQDENLEVRMILASNREAPVEVLQMLVADESAFVSVRAIGTLARIARAAGVTQIDTCKAEQKLLA